jgi:hypothetical protein
METGNIRLFSGNGNSQLPFVCGKRKRKTDVGFPWLANDKTEIDEL